VFFHQRWPRLILLDNLSQYIQQSSKVTPLGNFFKHLKLRVQRFRVNLFPADGPNPGVTFVPNDSPRDSKSSCNLSPGRSDVILTPIFA